MRFRIRISESRIFRKAAHKYCKSVRYSHILRLCPQTGRELAAGVTSVIFSNTPSGSKKKVSFSWNFHARLSPTKWVHKGQRLSLKLISANLRESEKSDSRMRKRKSGAESVKQRRWKLVELLTAATYFVQIYFEKKQLFLFQNRDLRKKMM